MFSERGDAGPKPVGAMIAIHAKDAPIKSSYGGLQASLQLLSSKWEVEQNQNVESKSLNK